MNDQTTQLRWTSHLPCNELLPAVWEVGENRNAFLVQSVEQCRTCGKHKAVVWIGKAFPDADQQAAKRVAELNDERRDPATQVDARFTGCGCDHRDRAFRWYRAPAGGER